MSFLEGKEDITEDWREKFLNTYKVSCSKMPPCLLTCFYQLDLKDSET